MDVSGGTQTLFEQGVSSISFVYDSSAPAVFITKPKNGSREMNLALLYGTAYDAAPGVLDRTQIRIARVSGSLRYWNLLSSGAAGGDFNVQPEDAETAWSTAAYSGSWADWNLSSGVPFVSGEQYRMEARSYDLAGNVSADYSTSTFVFDALPPVVSITTPAHGAFLNSLAAVSGTLADQPFGPLSSGTASAVWLRLTRHSDGQYWNGTQWSVFISTLKGAEGVATYVSSWTMPASTLEQNLTSGSSYYISASAVDNAENGGNRGAFGVSFSNVIYDTHPPVSFITAPANLASYRTLASITGTMSEKPDASASAVNSGVALTQVQIQRLTAPASYWTGADWSDSASWLTASTPTASSWQITGSSVPAWEHG